MRLYFPVARSEVDTIIDWVNERLPEQDDFRDSFAVAVIDETWKILAGAIFSNYSENNVFLSGAIDDKSVGKVTRGHLSDMMAAAFKRPLDCLRITALVSPTNKRSKRFVTGLGFQQEGILRDYMGKDTETLVFGLTKTEFEEGRYGRQQGRRRRAAS